MTNPFVPYQAGRMNGVNIFSKRKFAVGFFAFPSMPHIPLHHEQCVNGHIHGGASQRSWPHPRGSNTGVAIGSE